MASRRRHALGAAANPGADRDRTRSADIAFLDNHKGAITLDTLMVTAIVDRDLPRDSIDDLEAIS